jgi:hypothetical protein
MDVEQLALQREEQAARLKVLMQQLGVADEARKNQNAAIALQQLDAMGQGANVDPGIAATLRQTPYGVRLEDKQTLPSASIPAMGGAKISDAGGQSFTTLRPTVAQQREAGQRSELSQMASDQSLPPEMRSWVRARQAGVNVPNPESFITEGQREARAARERTADLGDFRTRANIQAGIADAARRRAANEVGVRDRVQALRLADAAAADWIDSIKGDYGILPEGVDPMEVQREYREAYLAVVDPAGTKRRVIDGLRMIVPQPGRTGTNLRTVELTPRRTGAMGGAAAAGPQSSDPYERYLARQRQ